jgi:membrane fusion protein (multidrug efflux system)
MDQAVPMRPGGGAPGAPRAWRLALLWAVAAVLPLSAPVAAAAPADPGAPAVVVQPVVAQDVSPQWRFIGRVEAIQAVDVRARVQGFLQQVAFREGQDVKTGDLLFVIEPEPYEAAVRAAEAQVAKAQATLTEAQRNLDRRQELRARGVEAQATLDQALADRDSAQADVAAAEANLQTARLNLGYTRIESPIDGRIGRAAVTKGNLVGPTDAAPLARVVQLDPIRVVYSIDDRALAAAKMKAGDVPQEALNARFVPQIRLASGEAYDQPGRIDFIDNEVDPNTGTVAVRAAFPNPLRVLLPGQFVSVVVHPERTEREPVVPVAAVQQDREGKYVMVVGPDDRVELRRIEADRQVDQRWVVRRGLQEGETVVVQGLQKVRPGIVVNPVPDQAAAAPASPGAAGPAAAPDSGGGPGARRSAANR